MIFHLKLDPGVKQNLRLCVENQGSNFLDLSPAGLDVTEEQAIGLRSDVLWQMKRGHISVSMSDGEGTAVHEMSIDDFETYTAPEVPAPGPRVTFTPDEPPV